MINGVVAERGPIIEIWIQGQRGTLVALNATVDTGFGLELSLAADTVRSLGLTRTGEHAVQFADGRVARIPCYDADLNWDDHETRIMVSEFGSERLVGMQLLAGYRLTVDANDKGEVKIERL